MKKWYQFWFDSPYYHILYKDRNDKEAKLFINHLVDLLKPPIGSRMLDQACGKGRHARHLQSLGFDITGIDLSQQSIKYCKKYENEQLTFFVQDMRRVFRINFFDYVFNLFTSFGYFDTDHQHQLAINAATVALKKDGLFIIDFMNVVRVTEELVSSATIIRDETTFTISKHIERGYIIKHISFNDKGSKFDFTEKVKLIGISDFERYFLNAGLKTIHLWGNYNLGPFDEKKSERLILVARKI